MTLSRKEFLLKGLLSYGRELVEAASGKEAAPSPSLRSFGPVSVDPDRCLARCSGCFACIDHCPEGAIELGREGLRVKDDLCSRCGSCSLVCPLYPPAIVVSTDDSVHPSPTKGGFR